MTSLVGASVLLIAGSALALIFGWVTANESLIWTSIAASVASGVALALAYGQARSEMPSGPGRPAPAGPTAEADVEAASPPAAEGDEVVGVPHTKRFHKPTCRYATAKNASNMAKSDALARGFAACGICKP